MSLLPEHELGLENSSINRRQFGRTSLEALLAYSLLETLFTHPAVAAESVPDAAVKWLKEVNTLAADVKEQRLKQVDWQKNVEELFRQIELPDLLSVLQFDALTKSAKLLDHGALSLKPKFPKVEGLSDQLVFGRQIFAMKKGGSVIPHGHNNMATAFLVLKGELHGRHYDRIEDQAEHLLIKPTIDRGFKPGETSSVSDFKDNIHWFKATSETAFIFNIHVLDVQPGSKLPTGRVYVNPNGEAVSGGLIRAPRLNVRQAHDLFG